MEGDAMILTVIESPFGSRTDGTRATPEEVARNVKYLHRCILDSLSRGEAPFASHGLYPGPLNDALPEERKLGMEAGFAWGEVAEKRAFYADYGFTPGMAEGSYRADVLGQPAETRFIGENP